MRAATVVPTVHTMPDRALPFGWKKLLSWGQVERLGRAGGVIVIFDDPTSSERSPRFHHVSCADVDERNFNAKRDNRWSTGEYAWAPDDRSARLLAVPCGSCGGQPVDV